MSNEPAKNARPSGCLIIVLILLVLAWIGVSCKPSAPEAKFTASNGEETCKSMVDANVSGPMQVQTSVLMGDTYKAVFMTRDNGKEEPWTCRLIWSSGEWKKDVLRPGR